MITAPDTKKTAGFVCSRMWSRRVEMVTPPQPRRVGCPAGRDGGVRGRMASVRTAGVFRMLGEVRVGA
ncbi:hypothetical protein BJF83_11845 [Nocardiopsis sp. CNR-923]|nr:hypothetical protein BJF83_11845 [Nocardiopsis sp. CNR-923]